MIYLFRILFIQKKVMNQFQFYDNDCALDYCSLEQYSSGECQINSKIKKQWLTNINYIRKKNFRYVNMATTINTHLLLAETTSNPGSYERIFYGLQENGRFYFKDSSTDEEIPIFSKGLVIPINMSLLLELC